jgi:hypothetical protein
MLALVYKNFAANAHISHIGLGVSALNTAKVLKRHGIPVTAKAINSIIDLDTFLRQHPDVNRVVISAAWLPLLHLGHLVCQYPHVEFAVNIHSNVGFLQADPNGVNLLQGYVDLAEELLNFRISGNSLKFTDWLSEAYTIASLYLPNLYNLDHKTLTNRPLYNGGTLRIGAFGATRPQKNFMTAAGAAIAISKELRVPVEFWMSGGREEGGGTIQRAITALLRSQPMVHLHILTWATWPEFLRFIESLHLMLQPSYTESFNMVTADGISRGVPSVVSDAIDWAPSNWITKMDDALLIARAGRNLITDPHAIVDGTKALEYHNRQGIQEWADFVGAGQVNYSSGVGIGPIR